MYNYCNMTMLHIILYRSNMHEANIYNRGSYSPKFRPLDAFVEQNISHLHRRNSKYNESRGFRISNTITKKGERHYISYTCHLTRRKEAFAYSSVISLVLYYVCTNVK